MTEINDINQYVVKAINETENWQDGILYFQPDWQNKRVIDLACNTGWLGSIALRDGADYLRFADARSVNFQAPDQGDYSFELVDISNREMLDNCLRDIDTIIYIGHFYHATNHEEILDAFERSGCSEIFFESKVFYQYDDYHEHSPDILWVDEPTDLNENVWHATAQSVLVGQPNFKWLHENLLKRFDIKNIAVFEKRHHNEFYDRTVFYKKVNFHCVKKSV
jgi:predicted nicotinamide N-methyase